MLQRKEIARRKESSRQQGNRTLDEDATGKIGIRGGNHS